MEKKKIASPYRRNEPCVRYEPQDPGEPTAPPDALNPGTMPDSTTEQIAQCIENSIQEVNRFTPNVPNSNISRKIGITMRNQPFILDAIEYAQQFPETVPTNVNIDAWLTCIKRYNIFILLFRLVDILWTSLRRAWRIFAIDSFVNFRNYYNYVRLLATSGNTNAQVIFERLKPYFNTLPRQRASEGNEDVEMEFAELQKLANKSNKRIDDLLIKEKEIKREIDKNIEVQDEILES
jgi:hypothetical protein